MVSESRIRKSRSGQGRKGTRMRTLVGVAVVTTVCLLMLFFVVPLLAATIGFYAYMLAVATIVVSAIILWNWMLGDWC
jgi:hypothetical protein